MYLREKIAFQLLSFSNFAIVDFYFFNIYSATLRSTGQFLWQLYICSQKNYNFNIILKTQIFN